MTALYFEDHPTDPEKVILRKKPHLDKGRDYEEGFIDGMQYQMQSSVDKAVNRMAQPEQEPVVMKFKIYKPTVPDPTKQDINNALLPWVYDQDRSSGFDASMWVTPVSTLPPQRTWVGLTDEEREIASWTDGSFGAGARWAEAKLKEKNI